MFRYGKWKLAIFVEKLNNPRSYNVKTENGSMYTRNWKHLLKTESIADQAIELSDDEERIKDPEETKSEIKTTSERTSKRTNWLKDYETF